MSKVFDLDSAEIDASLDMDHVALCAECAELLDIHHKLTFAFQGEVRSTPSIHFNRNMKIRLLDEQAYVRRVRQRTVVLRSYWLLAALASLFTLWSIPWSSAAMSVTVVVCVGFFVGLVGIVPVMIWRRLAISRGLIYRAELSGS
jgi:hypothetical protein